MGNEKDEQIKSQSQELVKGKDFQKLSEGTYFNANETEELFILFHKACSPMKELNDETFNTVFPSFKKDYRVQKSLFRAMDKDGGGTVAFPEFLKTLGQMFRGTVDEKANLALSIIDLDGDKKIQKKELYDVCKVIEEITKGVPTVDNITPAEQVVDSIFALEMNEKKLKNQQYLFLAEDHDTKTEIDFKDLKGSIEEMKESIEKNSEITIEQKILMKKALFQSHMESLKKVVAKEETKELDYEEFKKRAKSNVQFLSCFGMFNLFYEDIVLPIEKKLDKNVKKFGFPAVEGNIKCKSLFKNDDKYCQIQNGMMAFFDNYKHCVMNEKRWILDDSGLTKKVIKDDDDFSLTTFNLVKEIKSSGVVIGIHNFSKYTLDAPTINFTKGSAKKKFELKILSNSFGTGVFIPGGLLGGTLSGYLTYRIADSGSRFIVSFDMGITGKQFACKVIEEDADVSSSLLHKMKQTSLRRGSKDWIQHEFHMKAIIGKQDGKLGDSKCVFRVEFHDATECAPPIHVLDLTEATCKSKPDSMNTFTVSRSLWTYDFILEDQPELRDLWVSCISSNTNVTKLFDHPFHSFAPVHENSISKVFMTGSEYFEDLLENLKTAQDEILITGWFISPMFHLSRKKVEGEYVDRLDHILLDRAEAGCRIYILAWDELDAAFYLASKEMKQHFESLHQRIQVSRDPLMVGTCVYSHHQKTVIIDQQIAYVGGIDLAYNRYDDGTYKLTDEGEDQLYPGRHYVNPMMPAKNRNVGNPLEDVYDRSKIPRMPWQDYHAKVIGEPARDVARNFIQRWLLCKEGKHNFISLRETDYSNDEKLLKLMKENEKDLAQVQVLRSASNWSIGTNMTENSIFKAQVKAIKESKHFIYIENQFFVSSCTNVANPRNKLIGTLVDRVSKAIENKEAFRAIFLCPMHSSSPLNTKTLQNLTYWQLASMFQGPHSMLGVLQKKFPDIDVENYVTILCLRNWGQFKSGDYCNEMVYIHSKLMIVDDSIVFCSSANVNDRSMLGDRDSEIGVKITGNDLIDITMGGEKVTVSRIAHELRKKAMSRFAGRKIDDPDVVDPVLFYDDFRRIAHSNQEIYIEVFQKVVDNLEDAKDAKIISDYNHTLKAVNVERLKEIQGYVVPYPKKLFSKSYKQPDENDLLVNFYC